MAFDDTSPDYVACCGRWPLRVTTKVCYLLHVLAVFFMLSAGLYALGRDVHWAIAIVLPVVASAVCILLLMLTIAGIATVQPTLAMPLFCFDFSAFMTATTLMFYSVARLTMTLTTFLSLGGMAYAAYLTYLSRMIVVYLREKRRFEEGTGTEQERVRQRQNVFTVLEHQYYYYAPPPTYQSCVERDDDDDNNKPPVPPPPPYSTCTAAADHA